MRARPEDRVGGKDKEKAESPGKMNPQNGLPTIGLGTAVPTASPGVPTANLLALLSMQQQQGLGVINQHSIGLPGAPMTPLIMGSGGIPGVSMMPQPDLAAHMMQTFTPKPEDAPCVIFVGNLLAGITGDQLKQFFGSLFLKFASPHRILLCASSSPVPFSFCLQPKMR